MDSGVTRTRISPNNRDRPALVTLSSLASQRRWVAWQKERRDARAAQPTKIPYGRNAQRARADDSTTWLMRDEADALAARLQKPLGQGGIGLELGDIGGGLSIGGIDLDTCLDMTTGVIKPWAQQVIKAFNTYTEVSPSRTGVKLFITYWTDDLPRLRAAMNGQLWGRVFKGVGGDHPPSIELYLVICFFAVTEVRLSDAPETLCAIDADALVFLLTFTGPEFRKAEKRASEADLRPGPLASTTQGGHPHREPEIGVGGGRSHDRSRSGEAFRVAVKARRGGATFEEMVEAIYADPKTADWAREKGEANGRRELNRIWDKSDAAPLDHIEWTEDGIACAFATKHADDLKYDHDVGSWIEWNGQAWRKDRTDRGFSWSRIMCRNVRRNSEAPDSLAKASAAAAVERFARSDPSMAVTADHWDRDPMLLGTPGGTVDLRTGDLFPANPDDCITKLTGIAPDAEANCPRWVQFIADATDGDPELIRYLQQFFGYCLTGLTREHALLFIHGSGGNGKSVFLNTMAGILGEYAQVAAMETFTASNSDRHPTDLAMLRGARMVCVSETQDGRAWAESRIKQLTGGDPISARVMRQDFFTFLPQFKLVVVGNHKPSLRNVDEAARRRFNIVLFEHKPPEPDRDLERKLKADWPGILRWAIEGCLDWQRNGLVRPEVVVTATENYFAAQDIVHQWIDESCSLGSGESATAAILFGSWSDHAQANGEKPGSAKWFTQTLERLGCVSTKNTPGFHGKRGFLGIGLRLRSPAGDNGPTSRLGLDGAHGAGAPITVHAPAHTRTERSTVYDAPCAPPDLQEREARRKIATSQPGIRAAVEAITRQEQIPDPHPQPVNVLRARCGLAPK